MNSRHFINKIMVGIWLIFAMSVAHAGMPLWTFTPLTATTIRVAANDTATVSYQLTNQSKKSHTLVMESIPGVTQVTTPGNCPNPFVLGYQQSCILNLSINGSALKGDIFGGPVVCDQGNANQCYQPNDVDILHITTNATSLTASISELALSVTGFTEYGVTGTPSSGVARVITITNTGSIDAVNLAVAAPTWPSGTSNTTTCGSTLAASSSCTITIIPGTTATSNGINPCSTGTAPVPDVVQVSADNASPVSIDVVVLSYGCIYQGGYVYAFDDTTPNTGNVGGKVVTTTDQAAAYPNGVIWSSNGVSGNPSDVVYNSIYGISETSTTSSANPSSGQVSGQTACDGATNGLCDTNNIFVYYQNNATNAPINLAYYAAGLCKQTISTYSDWYLPAICEMGYGSSACGTSSVPTLQNIQSSLINISGFSAPAGLYWSSTEYSSVPQFYAWYEFFTSSGGSTQNGLIKAFQFGVRCSRAF